MNFKNSIQDKYTDVRSVHVSDWNIKSIEEVVASNEGNLNSASYYKVISYIDINSVENGQINEITTTDIKDASTQDSHIIRKGDLLIITVQPNLKHYCMTKSEFSNTLGSTYFASLFQKNVSK